MKGPDEKPPSAIWNVHLKLACLSGSYVNIQLFHFNSNEWEITQPTHRSLAHFRWTLQTALWGFSSELFIHTHTHTITYTFPTDYMYIHQFTHDSEWFWYTILVVHSSYKNYLCSFSKYKSFMHELICCLVLGDVHKRLHELQSGLICGKSWRNGAQCII